MSELIGIVGPSGCGKSTSIFKNEAIGIKGLDPAETVLINVAGKPLPFKGWKKMFTDFKGDTGNHLITDKADKIVKALIYINENRPEVKNIVIDDSQYIMGFKFIDKAMEKGYDKFNLLAKEYLAVLNTGRSLREDLKVFILTHSEEIYKDFEVVRKMKTLGKMLDQAITLEGLFTVLLYTHSTWDEKEAKAHYYFVTNKTSEYPSKSPIGMFDDIYIPNDLGYVADKIDEFNN